MEGSLEILELAGAKCLFVEGGTPWEEPHPSWGEW